MNADAHYLKTLHLSCGPEDLITAATLLRNGHIVALPTETVYGLAANACSPHAIKAIFTAKNRPHNNPLILHVSDSHQAQQLFDFSALSEQAKKRFERLSTLWPGPLTLVAKKSAAISLLATAGLESVAVRVPHNETTLAILRHIDFPLVMPSANISTRPSPTCAAHVLKTLNKRIAAVVDGGDCTVGIESTVIKIDAPQPELLRLGVIGKQQVEACLQESLAIKTGKSEQPTSPGQAYLHYSPAVKDIVLCTMEKASSYWHKDTIILARRSDFITLEKAYGVRAQGRHVLLENEQKDYAQGLYGALYDCENYGEQSLVIIEPPETNDLWSAVLDRLRRAAGLAIV